MHGIYASAREKPDPEVSGRGLYEETRRRSKKGKSFFYYEDVLEGEAELASFLKPGDLFLTMGAGNNWKLGEALKADLAARSGTK
jgi:UDP-N-acetylmuramate--alanine ligase